MKKEIGVAAVVALSLIAFSLSRAQGVAINASNAPADSSAMLDVSSLTKGILIPRLTQLQRQAIPSPATGLIIYQSDTLPGLYLNVGTPSSPAWMVFGGHPNSSNTFLGLTALASNTSGHDNTASGASALASNTTGFDNTAVGSSVLLSNTGGFANTANGAGALFSNTTGSDNTAAGFLTMLTNTTGNENTALGSVALSSNNTGGQNVAVGFGALNANTIGDSNAACGYNALAANTSGRWNTAVGNEALNANTTGSNNTGAGSRSLFANAGGSYNSAFGNAALESNTSGSYNTATGHEALLVDTGSYNAAYGAEALRSNISGSVNAAYGFDALANNTIGYGNTAVGSYALSTNVTGGNITAIGSGAGVSVDGLANATAIGAAAVVNASNKIRLGDGQITVIEGQVAYTFTSDSTKKEHHLPVDGEMALRKIREMNIGSWNYKGQDPKLFRHYGPMAQDFFAAFGRDEIGQIGNDTTICSGDLAGISLIAIQALERRGARIDALEKQISALQAENSRLKSALELLGEAHSADEARFARIEMMLHAPGTQSESVVGNVASGPSR